MIQVFVKENFAPRKQTNMNQLYCIVTNRHLNISSETKGESIVDLHTNSRWLSVEEIAEHLGVSKESIYRWLERGRIPAHRVGKQWRFQAEEVNEWVRRGEASDDSLIRKAGVQA